MSIHEQDTYFFPFIYILVLPRIVPIRRSGILRKTMPYTWRPTNGYWRNGQLVGEGEFIDEVNCRIYRGTFNTYGNLDGAECEIVDYSGNTVKVQKGEFYDGKEHGTVTEYTFTKNLWDNCCDLEHGVAATCCEKTYDDGVEQASANKPTKNVKAVVSRGGPLNNMTAFSVTVL